MPSSRSPATKACSRRSPPARSGPRWARSAWPESSASRPWSTRIVPTWCSSTRRFPEARTRQHRAGWRSSRRGPTTPERASRRCSTRSASARSGSAPSGRDHAWRSWTTPGSRSPRRRLRRRWPSLTGWGW